MSTVLPPIPRFIFTVFEPLSLFAGALVPLPDLKNFINPQIPTVPLGTPLTATNQILALQLINLYALLGMLGVGVLFWTTEPQVVKNWIIACAVGDVGHIYATYYAIGHAAFMDVGAWNIMAWGNIGVTAFLFVSRILYLLGVFGRDRKRTGTVGKGAKSN